MLIPTYDNPRTIRSVVERVRAHVSDVVVIDDGSAEAGRSECRALADEGLAEVVHRAANGGKGAAVKTGLRRAQELGYSHAFQVDADGQHDLRYIPRFLEVAARHPEALVLGAPRFDESAPRARRIGRTITIFWVDLETGGSIIEDPMCGFRVYPVAPAVSALPGADRMDFDPEIAVRMVWLGVPVINLPIEVRYLGAEEGGVSHFHVFTDNFLISVMHARLCIEKIFGKLVGRKFGPTTRLELESEL